MNIDQEIAALKRLSLARLRERYVELFGEAARSDNRAWLVRRLAWRIQERAFGGLSERAARRAAELADDADLRVVPPRVTSDARAPSTATSTAPTPPTMSTDRRLPQVGAILTRAYKGRAYEVKVLAEGFEWCGQRYGSLSAVAKAITGSHCNGFAFFGLTKEKR